MTPRTWFWLYAFALTAAIIAVAAIGVRHARKGNYQTHRARMNAVCWMVLVFVLSYVLKVAFLGKEDLDTWETGYVVTLRVHESFIAIMLVCGGYTRLLAHRFRRSLDATRIQSEFAAMRRRHRLLGRVAIVAAIAAMATATALIVGMMQRGGVF